MAKRQFDLFARYTDAYGNALRSSRIAFFDSNNVSHPVYDASDNSVGSTVVIDSAGRCLNQVFLDDIDYIVKFQKSSLNPTTHQTQWLTFKTFVNRRPTVTVDDTGVIPKNVMAVSNIADLQITDPEDLPLIGNNTNYVALLGYTTAGDKPLVYYKWFPNDTATSDGGSIITSTIADGNWKLVLGFSELDVRHFGIFPVFGSVDTNYHDGVVSHRSKLNSVITYANANGLTIFFPSIGQTSYYDIGGATLPSVKLGESTCLMVSHGFNASVTELNRGSYKSLSTITGETAGTIGVHGTIMHSTQAVGSSTNITLYPSDAIHIYDTGRSWSFEDCDVFLHVTLTTPISLSGCRLFVDSTKYVSVGNNTFVNMDISGKWFYDGAASTDVFTNCTTNIDSWTDIGDYIQFNIIRGVYSIDLQGRTTAQNITTSNNIAIALRNGSVGRISTGNNVTLDNISCSSIQSNGLSVGLNNVNCSGNINLGSSSVCSMINSYIGGNGNFGTLTANGSTLSKTFMANSVTFDNCDAITQTVGAQYSIQTISLTARNSRIGEVRIMPVTGTNACGNILIDNCKFDLVTLYNTVYSAPSIIITNSTYFGDTVRYPVTNMYASLDYANTNHYVKNNFNCINDNEMKMVNLGNDSKAFKVSSSEYSSWSGLSAYPFTQVIFEDIKYPTQSGSSYVDGSYGERAIFCIPTQYMKSQHPIDDFSNFEGVYGTLIINRTSPTKRLNDTIISAPLVKRLNDDYFYAVLSPTGIFTKRGTTRQQGESAVYLYDGFVESNLAVKTYAYSSGQWNEVAYNPGLNNITIQVKSI